MLAGEEKNGNFTRYLYDANGSPVGIQYHSSTSSANAWTTYWFEKNLQGDVVGVYNNSGTKLVSYTYDAFGNCTATTLGNAASTVANSRNPFRYRGYYYDQDLDVYYLQSRYYDQKTGRFISPDSVDYLDPSSFNGLNLYAYCNNNPVMYADPSGHSVIAVLAIAALIGGGISAGISIGGELLSGNFYPRDWDRKNILGSALVGAALGIATAAGGLAGIGAVSGCATVGLFAGTTALSFGAGAAQYALNYKDTDEFSWSGLFIDAGLTAVQSMISFGLGAKMSSSGMWKSLNKGEFMKSFSSFRTQGNNFAKSFFKSTGTFLKNNGTQIIERSFVRNVFTIPYTVLKYYI